MGLLVVFLLVSSLRLQVQAVDELSKEGILCISQNEEKTALGRWLHCLQISSSSNTEDAEADSFEIIDDFATEHFTEPLEADLRESKDILVANYHVLVEGEGNKGVSKHFIELEEVDLTEPKDILVANHRDFGDGEGNKGTLHLDKENAKDYAQSEATRVQEEDVLLSWLKLNFTILAAIRLVFGLFKRCSRKMSPVDSSEPSTMNLAEDSLEAVPEISKSIIVDNSATTNLRMLGSSLGSAVGAVFSEVLSKSCSSESRVPADKICMILESALKDLILQVQEDDCCSRLVGDFITYFRSTYTTMYRIQQACASYEGPGATVSCLNEENKSSNVKLTCEECMSAKSRTEAIHIERMDFEDNKGQVKYELSLEDASGISKQVSMKSSTVLAENAMPELSECSRSLAAPGERDLGASAAAAFDDHGVETNMKTEMHIPSCDRIDDPFEETLLRASAELTDEFVPHLDYEVEDASSVCEEPFSIMQSNAVGRLNTPLVGHSLGSCSSEFQKVFLRFYERHVQAQEQHNKFKYMKLQHLVKQQNLDEEKIQLASAANGLMRENINLGRSKASFKEKRVLEQQTKAAHENFCTTCADELAAGLCVMLTTLVYSVRMYSFALLNDLVSMCQPAVKEPRRSVGIHINWFYNSLDSLAGRLQAIVCQLTVTGRILIGSILVGIVAQSLLRRSVTSSSQAMPATILIIVLGGVCGFIGKVSVDSLGGSGSRWWVVWGTFCLLHALVNCFTPPIYRLLHGSPYRFKSKFGPPFWLRRLAFHLTLVLFLPLLAGLLPFGSFSSVVNDLLFTSIESLGGIFASIGGWTALSFQK